MSVKGPTIMEYKSCMSCVFHTVKMHRSGLNPIYDHYCKHTEAPHAVFARGEAWIGETDRTPNWCPIDTTY